MIDVKKSALVIIDMLYDFTCEGGCAYAESSRDIVPNVKSLLDGCRRRGMKIVFIQHCYREGKPDRNLNEMRKCQIETGNLQSTYTVLYDQTQLAIRIKASDKNLAKLDTSQINASIDLNGMGVGDYEVPVKITLPDGYELVDSVKTTIHIKEKAVANKTTGTN